jgi:hypothetical protein
MFRDASRDERQGNEREVEQKLLHVDYPFPVSRAKLSSARPTCKSIRSATLD